MSDPTGEPPPAGAPWGLALLLAIAHLVSFLDRSVLALVLDPIKAEFHVSDAALGLLQGTAFALFYGLAALPFGWLADRIDRIGQIAGGILLWSAATALGGLAPNYSALFASRLLVGLGEAALVPAALAMLAIAFHPHQLGRAVALFTGGASLGRSVALAGGGAILGMLAARGGLSLGPLGTLVPWRGLLVLLIIPGLLLAGLVLMLRRSPGHAAVCSLPNITAPLGRWSSSGLVLHIAAGSALLVVSQSLLAWAPAFLGRTFALTPMQAGLALGLVALIGAPLGHVTGGIATDALRARGRDLPGAQVLALALSLTLPCLAGLEASASVRTAILWIGAVSFFASMGAPAALTTLQQRVPAEARGRATAIFLTVTTLIGAGTGPVLTGLVTDLLGGGSALRLALPLTAGTAAIAGAAFALASRHRT